MKKNIYEKVKKIISRNSYVKILYTVEIKRKNHMYFLFDWMKNMFSKKPKPNCNKMV